MDGLLQQLVTTQSDRRPERPAVVWQNQVLTYRELEERSNQLARALREVGCDRGDRVCLLAPKTPMAVAAILAIYKADCIYVPVDVFGPFERLRRIVDVCNPQAVLTVQSSANALDELMGNAPAGFAPAVIGLEEDAIAGSRFESVMSSRTVDTLSSSPLGYRNRAGSPANIFFTWGASGGPKGVVITHDNLRHFVLWANQYFGVTHDDRHSGHSPLSFDLSLYDILGTLVAGACLFPVGVELNALPHALADFFRSARLTQWFSVPSVLRFIAQFDVVRPHDFPDLKRVMWCGDTLATPVLRHWMARLPHVRFTNLYGSTETTIASSYYTVPAPPQDDRQPIPIGRPCQGEQLLVVDDNLKPVPEGDTGEIGIRGVGLSPGYWRDSEATARAFVGQLRRGDPADRMYRTGDLGRVGPDGLLYFLGRRDRQVRRRGHPIELGAIEAALQTLSSLGESTVVAVPTPGSEGSVVCCAYVPAPGRQVPPSTLRRQLARLLPRYMVPSRWKAVDRLPLNPFGKTDLREVQRWFANDDPVPAH